MRLARERDSRNQGHWSAFPNCEDTLPVKDTEAHSKVKEKGKKLHRFPLSGVNCGSFPLMAAASLGGMRLTLGPVLQ